MTIAHLIVCGALSALIGFAAGWWRGRADEGAAIDGELDGLLNVIDRVRTTCAECDAPYDIVCPSGHPVSARTIAVAPKKPMPTSGDVQESK